ncbi:MFS transporter [Kordiimonas pumila]|uniref:MFS transporter n=1 Tax=Kordiimonas pumila TaxID=2161677 RepID=A0ABV7D6U1_9PROT|nr:MFS transporter [Kordiimonas pumila]
MMGLSGNNREASENVWVQTRVAVLCCIVAMLDGFDAQAIAFVAPVLADDWGIEPAKMGVIFSAALFGIMVGQLTLSPLSDIFGRRPVIMFCTLMFGVFSLLTAYSSDWVMLFILRFITGIGLGGVMPNLIALTSETAPKKHRSTIVTMMFGGFPIGAAIGGYLSNMIIPVYGWHSVFLMGGIIPLALLFPLFIWLKESPDFETDKALEKGGFILKLASAFRKQDGVEVSGNIITRYAALFMGTMKRITLPIWFAYFNSLLMVYFLFSWIPSLAKQSGLELDTAIISAVFLNIGGAIGGVMLGMVSDRFGAFKVLTVGYVCAGLSLVLMGLTAMDPRFLLWLVFASGFFVVGGQTAMNAAIANIYPAKVRATAIGAALAVGRAGSIVGPSVGGLLVASGMSLSAILIIIAVPAFLTAGISMWLAPHTKSAAN